jgi:hypothetical protein
MTEAESYAIRTTWREQARSISEIARILPAGRDWRRWIRDQGFRRVPSHESTWQRGQGWHVGPCSQCGEVYPAEEIRDAVCMACIECGPPTEQPSTAEMVRELYGVDLEAEREAHRQRMAQRAAGEREALEDDSVMRSTMTGTRIPYYAAW